MTGQIVNRPDSARGDSGTSGYFGDHVRRTRVGASGWVDVGWCSTCGAPLRLGLMHDAKTSGAVVWSNKGAEALVGNAIALPAGPIDIGGSCSGATDVCKACYAANLEAAYPALRAMASENLATVRHLLDHDGVVGLGVAFGVMVRDSVRRQTAAGIVRPVFRWHSDGDLLGRDHARAIAICARDTPTVEHWIYTRTLGAVRELVGIPNLRVLVSVDRCNVRRAATIAARYGVPVAVLADDDAERARIWARIRAIDTDRRIPADVKCPAAGKWQHDGRGPAHIVGGDGTRRSLARGGSAVGACVACRICLPSSPVGPRSVTFLVHGTARDALGSLARVRAVPVRIGGTR